MAIIFMDGFEHYGTGSTSQNNMTNYGIYSDVNSSSCSATLPRTGLRSCSFVNIEKTFGNLSTVGVGFASYLDTLPTGDTMKYFQFRDNNGNILCRFGLSNSQEFVLYRASNVEISRSTPSQITAGGWYHFECKFTPNGSTSSIELRINEVTVYTNNSFPIGLASGTLAGSTSTIVSSVDIDLSGILLSYIDDFYIWDTSGSYNNDFIGDKRVATMFPNADTSEADWTPNSGATGYTQIDENTPDGDSTYVSSSTVGDISEYDFEAMPTGAIGIAAVMTLTAGRKTDTGTCDIRTDIISGASDTSGTTQVLTTSYVMRTDIFETDPDTGSPWTKAGIDAAKVRIEREA
jgi:hypothetical protein